MRKFTLAKRNPAADPSSADGVAKAPPATDAPGERETSFAESQQWLLPSRVTIPEGVPNILQRPVLAARAAPAERRLTLLLAPGGFGKTTLLAECCRIAASDGTPTAWLSLDDDDPAAVDAYVAFALQRAGVDVRPHPHTANINAAVRHPRTTQVLHALDSAATHCVLALDEAERANPATVALLNFLVRMAPPSLHLAIAGRELPAGFDIADAVLDGRAELITAEDLRFTVEEVAALLGDGSAPAQARAILAATQGWPIAVRLQLDTDRQGRSRTASIMQQVTDEWVEGRLWPTLPTADRRFLLEVGQFNWCDQALLADVLREPDAMQRLTRMRQLDGLLDPTASGLLRRTVCIRCCATIACAPCAGTTRAVTASYTVVSPPRWPAATPPWTPYVTPARPATPR